MKVLIENPNAFQAFIDKHRDTLKMMMKGPDNLTDEDRKKVLEFMLLDLKEAEDMIDVIHDEDLH